MKPPAVRKSKSRRLSPNLTVKVFSSNSALRNYIYYNMNFSCRTYLELFVLFYVYDFIFGFQSPIISSFHSTRSRYKIKVLKAEDNEWLKNDGYYEVKIF